MRRAFLLLVMVNLAFMVHGQYTDINGVKVNQSMSDFHSAAKYRFTERSYGEYLTSYAGYESALVVVKSRADWVETVGITWNYKEKRTLGTILLNLHDYLVGLYGTPDIRSDFDEDGKHYFVRETFPITSDKVRITLTIAETEDGGRILFVRFDVTRRYF